MDGSLGRNNFSQNCAAVGVLLMLGVESCVCSSIQCQYGKLDIVYNRVIYGLQL